MYSNFEESNNRLWDILPEDQKKIVMKSGMCDIEPSFLGFVDIYEKLSQIIPKHFTVVDLGCAYNAQCFFFKEHKKYIAVDLDLGYDTKRFYTENCKIYIKKIEDFIKEDIGELNLEETFAICSYVPPWHGDNIKMVREAFKNVFTYYPHGESGKVNKQCIKK